MTPSPLMTPTMSSILTWQRRAAHDLRPSPSPHSSQVCPMPGVSVGCWAQGNWGKGDFPRDHHLPHAKCAQCKGSVLGVGCRWMEREARLGEGCRMGKGWHQEVFFHPFFPLSAFLPAFLLSFLLSSTYPSSHISCLSIFLPSLSVLFRSFFSSLLFFLA